jgi:predicted P-loop ATPase
MNVATQSAIGGAAAVNGLFGGYEMRRSGHEAARLYVDKVAGDDNVTFEGYFQKSDPRSKDSALRSRRVTGTFEECLETLRAWESEGRSVYMRVNEGGSTKDSITRVRAISLDFDAPESHHLRSQKLPTTWHVPPSLIVRRGQSVHAHWLVRDCEVDIADDLQRRLQVFYGADPAAIGRQRVWRVPGFAHPGYPAERVELLASDHAMAGDVYAVRDLETGLPAESQPSNSATALSANADREISTTEFCRVLSYIDPTMSDNYDRWVGLTKAIRHGQIPVTDPDNYSGDDIADDWCSGLLYRQRTGENFTVSTYLGREHLLAETCGSPRVGAKSFGLGTFIWLARKNGYIPAAVLAPLMGHPSFVLNAKTGRPQKTFENTLIAARHMASMPEWDEFNHRAVFRGVLPWSSRCNRVLDDELIREVRFHFLSSYGFETTKEHVSDAILTVAGQHRFHPVRDYLDRLDWDGQERLDSWLIDLCDVDDTPYARAVGRKFLVAAVARVFRPGCKFDSVLTLQGTQGAGKSTLARILASDEFFTDNISGDLGQADVVQSLQGRWIVELAELDGLRRSDVPTVKAFLSRTADRARFAYERHAADYPRQCVFIATTNEDAFLRDTTGNRRFWPVTVGVIRLDELRACRDQLWAEAVAAFHSGEALTLPEALWPDASAQQEERHAHDPWEEILRGYVEGSTSTPNSQLNRVHSSTLLWDALNIPRAQQRQDHSSRVKTLMTQRLGWEYRRQLRIGGKISSGYVRGLEVRKEIDDEEI